MHLLRFFLLLAWVFTGAILTDHSKRLVSAHKPVMALTEKEVCLRQVAALASVSPGIVQDGRPRSTDHGRFNEGYNPSTNAETEAIRDACKPMKEVKLEDGVLYASRQSACKGSADHN